LRDRAYAPDVLFYFFPDNDLNLVFVVFGHLPFVIGGGGCSARVRRLLWTNRERVTPWHPNHPCPYLA